MFDVLKERSTDWMEKIKVVEGSLEEADLGLSEENLQAITNDVSVLFHIAATIKFDAPIRYVHYSSNVTLMCVLRQCSSYVCLCQCYPYVRLSVLPLCVYSVYGCYPYVHHMSVLTLCVSYDIVNVTHTYQKSTGNL